MLKLDSDSILVTPNKSGNFPSFLIKSDENNFKNASKKEIDNMLNEEIIATFKTDGSSIKLFYIQHPNKDINKTFNTIFKRNNCIPFNIEELMELELNDTLIYNNVLNKKIQYKELNDKDEYRITNYFGICSRNFQLQLFSYNIII